MLMVRQGRGSGGAGDSERAETFVGPVEDGDAVEDLAAHVTKLRNDCNYGTFRSGTR